MIKKYLWLVFVFNGFFIQQTAYAADNDKAKKQAIEAVLNGFHQAAAKADGKTYFNLLSEDSIFLGTDATERWTKTQFKAFALPYFSKGQGWLYTPTARHINLSSDGSMAFFDELLTNESYGVCRGTGVLWFTKQGWKIAQYNLSIPMPNAIAGDLVKRIQSHQHMQQEKKHD